MTTVRIYQPAKTAMQAGLAKIKEWRVEFETHDPLIVEPLMGWVQSNDMTQELHLEFPSLEKALHYAISRGFSYVVSTPPKVLSLVPKNYAANFTNSRVRGI